MYVCPHSRNVSKREAGRVRAELLCDRMFNICVHTILGNTLSTDQSRLHTLPHLSKPRAHDGSDTLTSVSFLLSPSLTYALAKETV